MPRFRPLVAAAALLTAGLSVPQAQASGTAALDLSTAFDKDCVSPRYLAAQGNCDGGIMSAALVAEALPAGTITVKGQPFTIGAGTNQSATGMEQVVKAPSLKGAQYLHVLATAVNAGSTTKGGRVTITYTSGQTATAELQAHDWAAQAAKAAVVVEAQSLSSVGPLSYKRHLFVVTIPVNKKWTVASVKLPKAAPDLRVFAMTLSFTDVKAAGPVFS